MLKYKTLMFVPVICIALQVFGNLIRIDSFSLIGYLRFAMQIAYECTFIIMLKKHKESSWLSLPFYLLIADTIFTYYIQRSLIIHFAQANQLVSYYTIIGLLYIAINIYMLINAFFIKNKYVGRYMKIKSMILLVLSSVGYILPRLMPVVIYMAFAKYYNLLFILPQLLVIVLYYNLYNRYEFFKPGDHILTKTDLENIPAGTVGVVLQKHSNSNYFEVEFIDDNGNLLNVLSISADEIEHTAAVDLETRVESFAKELS